MFLVAEGMDNRNQNRIYIYRKSIDIPSKLKDVSSQCLHIVGLIIIVSAHTMSPSHSNTESAVLSTTHVAFHPRLSELHPDNFRGVEGSKVVGFDLKKSLVVMTPALATPPDHVTGNPSFSTDVINLCNFKKYSENHKSNKVQNYLEILSLKERTKHKQKKNSGFKILQPVIQDEEVCESKGLTAVGVSQAIHLGEYLSRAYTGKLQILNRVTLHESLAETIGDAVLYQSLNAFLHGLLSEKQFLATDVAKLSSDFTTGTSTRDKQLKFRDELHYFVDRAYKSEGLLFKEHKFTFADPEVNLPTKDILAYLLNIIHSIDLKEDNLLDNFDLSFWDVDDLFNKSDSHNIYLASSPVFQVYANHQTYYLRQRMAEFLSFKDQSHSDVKSDFKSLAVDDLTMLSLLVSLNLTVDRHLQPLSRLVVEVWSRSSLVDHTGSELIVENQVSSHNTKLKDSQPVTKVTSPATNVNHLTLTTLHPTYRENVGSFSDENTGQYVKVLLNGNSVTSSIPDCFTDVLVSLELCSAETFVNFLSFLVDVNERKVEL